MLVYEQFPLNCSVGICSENTLLIVGGIDISIDAGLNTVYKINFSTNIISE